MGEQFGMQIKRVDRDIRSDFRLLFSDQPAPHEYAQERRALVVGAVGLSAVALLGACARGFGPEPTPPPAAAAPTAKVCAVSGIKLISTLIAFKCFGPFTSIYWFFTLCFTWHPIFSSNLGN